jgi:hypothetical protein
MKMKDQTPDDLKAAAEYFLRVAKQHKAVVVGFAFGATPVFIMRFGNTNEQGDDLKKLYNELADMSSTKIREGKQVLHTVTEVV